MRFDDVIIGARQNRLDKALLRHTKQTGENASNGFLDAKFLHSMRGRAPIPRATEDYSRQANHLDSRGKRTNSGSASNGFSAKLRCTVKQCQVERKITSQRCRNDERMTRKLSSQSRLDHFLTSYFHVIVIFSPARGDISRRRINPAKRIALTYEVNIERNSGRVHQIVRFSTSLFDIP